MTAWAATAIRNVQPDAKLIWAVETRCEPVIDRSLLVQQVLSVPRQKWKRNRWSPKTWQEQLSMYLSLRNKDIDFGIDFQGHSKTALMLRLANPKRRIAVRATDAFASRLNPLLSLEPGHIVEQNVVGVKALFGNAEVPIRPLMPPVESKPQVITISVSTSHPPKNYAPENWAKVAKLLLKEGFPVAFLGAAGDPLIDVKGAESFVGKLPLAETMAHVASSSVHLSADTGTGHMAAAYGVPSVTIFGPSRPEEAKPYSPKSVALKVSEDPNSVSPESIVEATIKVVSCHPQNPKESS